MNLLAGVVLVGIAMFLVSTVVVVWRQLKSKKAEKEARIRASGVAAGNAARINAAYNKEVADHDQREKKLQELKQFGEDSGKIADGLKQLRTLEDYKRQNILPILDLLSKLPPAAPEPLFKVEQAPEPTFTHPDGTVHDQPVISDTSPAAIAWWTSPKGMEARKETEEAGRKLLETIGNLKEVLDKNMEEMSKRCGTVLEAGLPQVERVAERVYVQPPQVQPSQPSYGKTGIVESIGNTVLNNPILVDLGVGYLAAKMLAEKLGKHDPHEWDQLLGKKESSGSKPEGEWDHLLGKKDKDK